MAEVNATKSYVDTQDNELKLEFQRLYEDFTSEVTDTLESYEDYLAGRIGSIHNEVWEGVDSALSTSSTFPVQNKVITNALNNKANLNHNHDNRYYTETEIDNFLNNKVSVVNGKTLSTNDYTNADKNIVTSVGAFMANAADYVTGIKGDGELEYRHGNVNITKAHIGLGNVDNTSDTNKPISTATQTALNNKVDKISGKGLSTNDFSNEYKSLLDNLVIPSITIDTNLSTTSVNPVQNGVVASALNLKAPINNPAFTGTPTAPTAAAGTNTNQIATTAFVQSTVAANAFSITVDSALNTDSTNPVQNGIITTTLNTKADLNSPIFTGTPIAPTPQGHNINQIATVEYVNNQIIRPSFVVTYNMTDPQTIYQKFTQGYIIYCNYNGGIYYLVSAVSTSTTLVIQLINIDDTTINSININCYKNNQDEWEEYWSLGQDYYVNAVSPYVYTYPQYDGFNNNTPAPTLDNQFVTKKYVDGLVNMSAVGLITYTGTEGIVTLSNCPYYESLRNNNLTTLQTTGSVIGFTGDSNNIYLTNRSEEAFIFNGIYKYGEGLYYITIIFNLDPPPEGEQPTTGHWSSSVVKIYTEADINSNFTKVLVTSNAHLVAINKTLSDSNDSTIDDVIISTPLFTTNSNLSGTVRGRISLEAYSIDLNDSTQTIGEIHWSIYENSTNNIVNSGTWGSSVGNYSTTINIEIPITGNNKTYGMILTIPQANQNFENYGSITFNSIYYDVQVTSPWSVQVSS